jgi:hypothetical protein
MCLILTGLVNCKKENKPFGFFLQRFDVVNAQLDSIIQGIKDNTNIRGVLDPKKGVIIMVLRVYDSNPEFCFTLTETDDISVKYIFENNRRIVGYIDTEDFSLIVLSDESSQFDFVSNFYKFLIPTQNTKFFEYIYFPDNLYCIPDSNGIPCPPSFFNPYYYSYLYKDAQFIYMD